MMAEENLNIDHHTRLLALKALNTSPSKLQAAKALGITKQTLYNLIFRYSIVRDAAGKYCSHVKKPTIQYE